MKLSPSIWLEETDSTNNEAQRRINTLENLSVIVSKSQTQGRGQGNHKWFSTPGLNLTFSLVLKFPPCSTVRTSDILCITETVTMAVCSYLEAKGINTRIKWPNDIYVNDRKICGLLIENALSQKTVCYSIIGIGLNVNQTVFPDDIPNPVSISLLTGKEYDLPVELELLRTYISLSVSLLESAEGRIALRDYFKERVFNVDEGLLL